MWKRALDLLMAGDNPFKLFIATSVLVFVLIGFFFRTHVEHLVYPVEGARERNERIRKLANDYPAHEDRWHECIARFRVAVEALGVELEAPKGRSPAKLAKAENSLRTQIVLCRAEIDRIRLLLIAGGMIEQNRAVHESLPAAVEVLDRVERKVINLIQNPHPSRSPASEATKFDAQALVRETDEQLTAAMEETRRRVLAFVRNGIRTPQ